MYLGAVFVSRDVVTGEMDLVSGLSEILVARKANRH